MEGVRYTKKNHMPLLWVPRSFPHHGYTSRAGELSSALRACNFPRSNNRFVYISRAGELNVRSVAA